MFISYAEQDQPLVDLLEKHLSALKHRGLIIPWHKRKITPGQEIAAQIDAHFDAADIILVCISADFLASDYCYAIEMKRALERHKNREACVIPILLRPVHFAGLPLMELEMLPANRKPVLKWSDLDSAFVDIAEGIERVLQTGNPELISYGGKLGLVEAAIGTAMATGIVFFNLLSKLLGLVGFASIGFFLYQYLGFFPVIVWGVLGLLYLKALVAFYLQKYREREVRHGGWIEIEHGRRGIFDWSEGTLSRGSLKPGPIEQLKNELKSMIDWLVRSFRVVMSSLILIGGVISIGYFLFQHSRFLLVGSLILMSLLLLIGAIGVIIELLNNQKRKKNYYTLSLNAFRELFQHNSPDVIAQRGKAMALVGLGQHEEALAVLENSASLHPQAATYVDMGNILLQLKRYNEAVIAYKYALELHSTYALAYIGMHKALKRLRRRQEAKESRKQAKQLNY